MKHPLLRLLNSIIRRPSPPAHRNRTARRRAVPALQTLERRLLLSADLDLTVATDNVVPGEEVAAEIRWINGNGEFEAQQQVDLGGLIGPSLFTVNVGLDNPFGGIFVGDTFEVFGSHGGQAAIDDGEVLLFDSIASSQGESGDPTGRIIGAQILADGSVIYLGQSWGTSSNEPTFWFEGDDPFHPLANGQSSSGELRASALDGTFVGTSGFVNAAYGSVASNSLQALPGHGANIALDISWDAELIVGGEFIWFRNEFGGYSVLDTSDFQPDESGGLPDFLGVELDASGDAYFGGNAFDLFQAVPTASFYDESGSHLGSFHGTYAGMAEVDGRVIAAVQGFDEGFLVDLSSGDVLTTTDLLGAPALFGADTAIFSTEGGLGLLLLDEDGYFVSVHETSVTDGPNPGPDLVDIFVDSTGDGEFDMFFPETDFEQFTLSFPSAGTYTVSVVAMDANLEEVASASQEVVVSAFRVENRDDADVLLVGADQENGSTIQVIVRGGLTSVAVDDLEDEVSGDAPVSLVEVIGSPVADHVTLDGPFAASVDLRGGDDTLVIIGLSDFEVASGEELELFVADSPLQNALQPADVDGDGNVSPLDALLILNQLARSARDGLSGAEAFEQLLDDPKRHHYDVGGNGRIEPLDALLVLNHIARAARPAADGEDQPQQPPPPLDDQLVFTIATNTAVPGEMVAATVRWLSDGEPVAAQTGQQTGDFAELIGPALLALAIDLQNPRAATSFDAVVHVAGQHQGRAARQLIDLGSGTAGPVELFDSIASAQGSTGNTDGRINQVAVLDDGRVVYLGQSAGFEFQAEPTFWFDINSPVQQLSVIGGTDSGELRASSRQGVFVGSSGFLTASYANLGENFQTLPGFGANIALDISSDAEFAVGGGFIWQANEFGGYGVLDQSDWEPDQSGGFPNFLGVELDASGGAYFGGNAFDLFEAVPTASFYDQSGTHLGSYHGTFAGLAQVDGRVIGAVQGFDEGLLVDLVSGEVLTTTDLLGAPAMFGSDTAIFSTEDGFGMLLVDLENFQTFVSIHETSVTGDPDTGPQQVDIRVDSTGDGEFDLHFPETDSESFTVSFPRPGTYTLGTVALDADGEQIAAAAQVIEVSAFRVENRDDADVLLVGADQEFGSTIRVIVRGGLTSVAVDDLEDEVSGDAPVSLVDVIGSPAADHVTLDGPFAASVDLRGGDDTLVIIGLVDFDVASGDGDGPALFVADSPLQNALQPADVDGDGNVSPLDALLILNQLARSARDGLSGAEAFEQLLDDPNRHHYDVGGNGRIEPLDALLVLNHIARAARPPADGEDQPQQPQPPLDDQLVFTIATNTAVPGEMVAATVRWLSAGEPAAAQTGDFGELLGPSLLPVPIELDNPLAATSFEGVVHVAGKHQGQAARQLIDLSTGTAGGVELFDSIASAQGSTGNTAGRINQVGVLDSGQVVYLGQSAGSLFPDQPTYWAQSTEPIHPLFNGLSRSGELRAIARDGTFVGTSGFVDAAYGNVQTNNMQALPGFGANIALDISSDAEYILGGAFIWQANEIGGYGVFDTSNFEATPAGNNNPAWQAVAIDPVVGGAVFAGSYFDINSFTTKIGFWREDGSFIGASGDGTAFRDFEVWEGQLVAAVTDFDDSFLIAISDFSSIALEDILGSKAVLAERGLFVHQPSSEPQTQEDHSLPIENELVGFVIQGADGPSVAISEVNPAEIFPPELVDIRVDSTGDGELDLFFPETDFEQFTLSFPSAGTYTVSVVAMDANLEEVASASQEVVVSAFRVENRDDADVLLVGADQENGSTIRVIVRGGLTSVAVDDLEDEVSDDAPVSLVEVIGSPAADHVTLDGPFAASVDLRGGDDTLVIIGLSDFEVASGEGLELFVADSPLQNALQPADVDGDGNVSPLDALLILNQLARSARDGLSGAEAFEQLLDDPKRHHYDVGGNGRIEPLDALLVLNHIARAARPPADGEAPPLPLSLAAQRADRALATTTRHWPVASADADRNNVSDDDERFPWGTPLF